MGSFLKKRHTENSTQAINKQKDHNKKQNHDGPNVAYKGQSSLLFDQKSLSYDDAESESRQPIANRQWSI